uniref:DNA-directed RNA polymerase subunit beta n=1 Tax=Euglena clara TaxID=215708 RepID=A0A2Z4YYY9_9EUGL|nr:RNA polymerase beta subunit [Euglena clara]AXA45453.1 RNA polymerase beta subunit [Euglena clara]
MKKKTRIISNLLEIQRKSFQEFLKNGLKEGIKEISKIKHLNFEIKIHTDKIKYKQPIHSIQTCLAKNKTYDVKIYLPIEISKRKIKTQKSKYINIGKIPIMTEKGTFILNGNTRIIINQIVRSPGIYFENDKKTGSLTGTIIPSKGSWMTIGEIYIKIDNMKIKIPAFLLLRAMGLSKKKILFLTKKELITKGLIINKATSYNIENSILELNNKITEQDSNLMNARNFLYSKFFDRNNYDLGEIGRIKINKKFYKKNLFANSKNLKPEDILGVINYMTKLNTGKIETTDDIDDLKNKRIRSVGELLENQINTISQELKKNTKEKIEFLEEKIQRKNLNLISSEIINSYLFSNNIKRFFINNPLSQIMEETNPLAEITHKRKVSSFGIGAIDRKKAKIKVREIHSSQYGRICPIETSEGKNAGLILSLAKDIKLNKYGFIETPFYLRVLKRKIKVKKGIFFISAEKEKNLNLAAGDIYRNVKNKLSNKKKLYYVRKNQSFSASTTQKINFISTSTNQIISVGTGLIPFIEHNDANRALMGSNMQRQALALKKKEMPLIETGMELEIAKESQSTSRAKRSGVIKYQSIKKIVIEEVLNPQTSAIINKKNKSFMEKIKHNYKVENKNKIYRKIYYELERARKSNQNSYLKQNPTLKEAEWVEKGQIISDGKGTTKGKLTLGRNILIGYIGWEGYNFEDAIVISEKLVKEDTLTSIHIKRYKTYLIKNDNEEEIVTRNIPNISIKTVKNLKKNGIIKVGSKINNQEIIIGKIKIRKEKTILSKLLNNIFRKTLKKDISLKMPNGITGTITKIKINRKKLIQSIQIFITETRKIQLGDKIAGRHGNKGIVSKILPIPDMPYLQDGTSLDMLLNPLGIPSRMNVGQIYECLLTLAAVSLIEKYKIMPFDEMQNEQTSKIIVYKKLNEAKLKTGKKWLFNPSYAGKTKIFDGRNGKPFSQNVSIGYAYMLKLMHLVKDKINARLTGPYSLILKQPVRGKARNGGQRFGEMEVWAIEGFGAAYILQELLTIKSDDLKNRSKTLFNIIKGLELPSPNVPESFKALVIEIQCLCIELNIFTNKKKFFY